MLLTYATALAYLLALGQRFLPIGRSELTYTGEPSGLLPYPLLLVEGDAAGQELVGNPSLDTFTIAVQVLTKQQREDVSEWPALLVLTNQWADQLTEQLRQERSGQLSGVNKLCLPGQAGSDLAIGWRVELTLKVAREVNRTTNRDSFAPEV